MTIDVSAALRRVKPHRRTQQLKVRPIADLPGVPSLDTDGTPGFVMDTNVYIRAASGSLPDAVRAFFDRGLASHCSVCVAELTTGIANADPQHPNWKRTRDYYLGVIDAINVGRLLTPDAQIWAEAGLIAGTLARTQNFQRHQRKECLNDALILLTAAKAGLPVLTADRDDFDLIQQLVPQGRFLYF